MDLTQFRKPTTLALVGLSVLTVFTIGSAIRFDYRRRHDPVFRNKLNKEKRRVEKSGAEGRQEDIRILSQTLTRALIAIRNEPQPETNEEKEAYFMDQVALGEAAAARSPDFYIPSALYFYKALKVYPAPAELAQIYQKTQPPAVFALVMELISLDAQLFANADNDPRDRTDSALLEEIVEPTPPASTSTILPAVPTAETPAAPASENGSGSGNGSYVHVESETVAVVGEDGEVVVEKERVVVEVVGEGEDPPEIAA